MCQITKNFTICPALLNWNYLIWTLFGAFFGDSTQTSKHLLKEVLRRMFPAIYNFSIIWIRDFHCSSNDDLTNILATTLSAADHFNPWLSNTEYYFTLVYILTIKYSHVWQDFSHNLSPAYSRLELCLTNYLVGLIKMTLYRSTDLKGFSD